MGAFKRSSVTSESGCRIAVFEAGNRDGLECLFIHGFAMDHSVWQYQFTSSLLREHCRLVAFDLRGHGKSCKPGSREAYSDGRAWASDLAAVIKSKKLQKPVLVSWSFGGRIVNDYIRYFGQSRLAGINYIAAASVSDPDVIRSGHALLNAICSEHVAPEKQDANIEQYVNKVVQLSRDEETFRHLCSVVRSIPIETRKYLRGRVMDYDDLLPGIRVPVLVTHGEQDCMFDPAMSRRLAARVAAGRASVYADAGHAAFHDQPERFNRELLEFARRCRQGN